MSLHVVAGAQLGESMCARRRSERRLNCWDAGADRGGCLHTAGGLEWASWGAFLDPEGLLRH